MMKPYQYISWFLILLLSACAPSGDIKNTIVKQHVWAVNSTDSIGGHPTEVSGNPRLVTAGDGKAVEFDGDGDRLLVMDNPLQGASEFTIEIVFKPNAAYPDNVEPRFFHIESSENPNRRVTVELRLNDTNGWYLDTFIKSDHSKHTLIDESLTHPVEVWAHAAITYKDQVFTSYVNGVKERSAEVQYLPIPASAKASIGARMNRVHWFNGVISHVTVTHKAMRPDGFALLATARQMQNK
jgi:hypothetical protein